ncbi:N-acetylmuramoyl-L-alanine amidase [bacterium]|nr:N-acetylmuramoyl-L-alanine amidase [bacterium]
MANGTVYADLESALQKEGISMIKRPDSVELIVGAKTYRFDTASPDVRIGFGGKVETRGVGYPLIVKNGVPYLAIRGLAAALNYGLMWDSASRRIQLLNSIQRVAVLNQGGLYKAVIHASHPVSSLPAVPLNRENGFSVDLLNAQLAFDDETMESDNSPVYQMTVSQVSDTRVRISLVLKSSVGYSSVIPNSMGGEMLLSSRITTIDSRIDGQAVVFRIEGIGSFTPKVWALPSPSIVVLDVPESYSLVPMVIRPVQGQSTVQLVRTSQFKLDPPATRIVFDTVSTRNYAVTRISSSTYEIRFPIAAGVTLPVVVTPTRSVSGHTAHVTSNRLASGNVIASASGTISLSPTSHIIARPVTLTSAVRTQKISKPTPQRPLYRKVIVIDPGHGGSDPGSIGVNNTYEKEITIDISRRLKSALEAEGAVVIMCRNNDENPSLQERCDVGNVNNADLFISVHINSFFHPYASGTETYYYKPEDKLFSAYVHEEMVKTLGFRDNGLKRARLYVLRNTKMPALLVEPGFITNPQEFAHMNTPSGRQKIAEAIVQGTVRYVSAR